MQKNGHIILMNACNHCFNVYFLYNPNSELSINKYVCVCVLVATFACGSVLNNVQIDNVYKPYVRLVVSLKLLN